MKLKKFFSLVTKNDKIVTDVLSYLRDSGFLDRYEYKIITAELLTSLNKQEYIVKVKIFETITAIRELLVDINYIDDSIYYTIYQEV